MRFLSNSEHQQIAQLSEKIVNGPAREQNSATSFFYPKMVEDHGAISPQTWARMPKSGKKAFIFLLICSDLHCNHGGYEKLMKKQSLGNRGLGRDIWTPNLATLNERHAKPLGVKVIAGSRYSGLKDVKLSKDVYIFQHYAEYSVLGIANPPVADPDVLMQDAISGSATAKGANRDGIIGERTMSELVALVNSGYTRVGTEAAPLAPAGVEVGKRLVEALSWSALDAAKANPQMSEVPAEPEELNCSKIADYLLLAPGSENNPAYKHCLDRIRRLREQADRNNNSGSQPPPKPNVNIDFLKTQVSDYFKKNLPKIAPPPGLPGYDYSKLKDILAKRKPITPVNIPSVSPPPSHAPDNPVDNEPEFEVSEFDEPQPQPEPEADTQEEVEVASDEKKVQADKEAEPTKSATFFFTEEGKLKTWVIGAGIAGIAGLAWFLFKSSGDEIEYNQFGQPLQPYDENGNPIILLNSAGQPLQCYDQQGSPVYLTNSSGQPLQTYTEDGVAIGQRDSNGDFMKLYDSRGVAVSVNEYVNATRKNPTGLYKRMY